MPLHPHYRDVVATHARFLGFELAEGAADPAGTEDLAALIDDQTSCVVVQNPSFFGSLRDLSALAEAAHAKGALMVVAVRSEEHTSELQSLMRISYAVFCLTQKKTRRTH